MRRAFLNIAANHKEIASHHADDAKRELYYAELTVDRSKGDAAEIFALTDEFIVAVEQAGKAGLAKPDFVNSSVSIAKELQAAVFAAPPAPVGAMEQNREFAQYFRLSRADRAIIKALSFSLKIGKTLDTGTPEQKKKFEDLSVGTLSSMLGNALSRLIGL